MRTQSSPADSSSAQAPVSPARAPLRHWRPRLPRIQELGLIVVVLVLGTALSVYGSYDAAGGTNTFLNLDNLVGQIATYMAVYAIMSVGVTCVIITGGIDISVGAIYALSALACAGVLQNLPPDAPAWIVLPVALLVGPGVGVLCGLLNGLLVTLLRLHPFIVTLGTLSIFRGIGNVATTIKTLPSQGKSIPDAFTTDFMQRYFFETAPGEGGVQLMPLIVMLLVGLAGWFYLRLTVAGRQSYAVGGNEEAARFSGIRVNLVKLRVYAISGLTAGIAGIVSLGWFSTTSTNTGSGYELYVIAAAVVGGASLTGGRGTALGAILGALVIRMIENGIFKLHLNQEYSQIIVGSAIILAVTIDRVSEYLRARHLAGARRALQRAVRKEEQQAC
ncbi:MAG TPA: ABC transporter permease [Tepidisphaeraceae bacterium]|nr:ABC transporter permease [Tepidisphaeraceae bacterium]